ncbi:MAG: hypothetical protein K8T89_12220 [Planctomycetes bacterium]|nr:hypothetical protein [Planctomycetota bacterium]
MKTHETSPQVEDLVSVGSRISWPAVLAGAAIALGIYFLFGTLGTAAGLSISDRANITTLQTGAVIWVIFISALAMFVGGVVASVLTAGENKIESMVYGVIMWAVLSTLILGVGAMGARSGLSALASFNNNPNSSTSWEATAREAGVPADKVDEWRRSRPDGVAKTVQEDENQKIIKETATRAAWFAFFGTWISMLAAALGGWVGSGPTFRFVTMAPARAH